MVGMKPAKNTLWAFSVIAMGVIAGGCGAHSSGHVAVEKNAEGHGPVPKRDVAQVSLSSAGKRCQELLPLIEKGAKTVGVDVALMVGIIRTESNFRNDVKSNVGAVGLTQCMPATAKAKKCGPLSDPYENILCGARVIQGFMKYYKNSLYLALSGYNAGHGMPDRARKTSTLPANVDYIEKVLWARSRYLKRGCDF